MLVTQTQAYNACYPNSSIQCNLLQLRCSGCIFFYGIFLDFHLVILLVSNFSPGEMMLTRCTVCIWRISVVLHLPSFQTTNTLPPSSPPLHRCGRCSWEGQYTVCFRVQCTEGNKDPRFLAGSTAIFLKITWLVDKDLYTSRFPSFSFLSEDVQPRFLQYAL